jgi:type I restriction enzyme S subunit
MLDKFTELEMELRLQLEARRKQYHYYQDKLLQFKDKEAEWASIEEIFILRDGYTPSKSNKAFWTNGSIPWFRLEDIRENRPILSKSIQLISGDTIKGGKLFLTNSILIANSATISEHALITIAHLSNQRFTSLSLKPTFAGLFDMRFVFYYCFIVSKWCLNNKNTLNFSSINMIDFRKFKFPVPSPQEQKQVVSILDKFDALVNDLLIGLPVEINAHPSSNMNITGISCYI